MFDTHTLKWLTKVILASFVILGPSIRSDSATSNIKGQLVRIFGKTEATYYVLTVNYSASF